MKRLWGRQLRLYKCPWLLEGMCFLDGEFIVNVEYLWNDTKSEDKFIKRFAKAYRHEFLHSLLLDIPKKYEKGEEKIIRKYIDNEKWTDELERFYGNDNTKSIPKQRPKGISFKS
jgi:hypothetical protein